MHYWGDEWFKSHGEHLYDAIDYIETNLRKNGISVCGKEKYGTYRNEYLRFWDGSLYQFLFRGRMYIGPKRHSNVHFIAAIQDWFHRYIYWRIDYGWTWRMMTEKDSEKSVELIREHQRHGRKGLRQCVRNTRWYARYIDRKKDVFNRVFQEACAKWPDVVDELVCDIDGWEWIKPGKYGDVSGEDIHYKYWQPAKDLIAEAKNNEIKENKSGKKKKQD